MWELRGGGLVEGHPKGPTPIPPVYIRYDGSDKVTNDSTRSVVLRTFIHKERDPYSFSL